MYTCDVGRGFELGSSAHEAAAKPTELRKRTYSKELLYNTSCL